MISIVVHTLGSEYLDASLVASRRSGDGGEMPEGYRSRATRAAFYS